MQHPVVYLTRVTKFLDSLIQEHGDYLFVAFFFLCVLFLAWFFARRRKHRASGGISMVIFPIGHAPRNQPEQEPIVFRDPNYD